MNEVSKNLERGLYGAVLFIDENNGCVEIDGDSDLKTFLYEVTPYVLSRWRVREKNQTIYKHWNDRFPSRVEATLLVKCQCRLVTRNNRNSRGFEVCN